MTEANSKVGDPRRRVQDLIDHWRDEAKQRLDWTGVGPTMRAMADELETLVADLDAVLGVPSESERRFKWYQLPGGRYIPVDASAAKDARVIDFTMEDGRIVSAVEADLSIFGCHEHTWTCGCGWRNGVNLATCATCGRSPFNGDNLCTQDEDCHHAVALKKAEAELALLRVGGGDPPTVQTECCDVAIAADTRYCPKCGYECRIEAGGSGPPSGAESNENCHFAPLKSGSGGSALGGVFFARDLFSERMKRYRWTRDGMIEHPDGGCLTGARPLPTLLEGEARRAGDL